MGRPGRRAERLDRLDVRIVALLGLALLPIGLIAMVQTYRVIDDSNTRIEAALLGQTLAAASSEREIILEGIGAANAARGIVSAVAPGGADCSVQMRALTLGIEAVFAGFVDNSGMVRCGSDGVGTDVSDTDIFREFQETGSSSIETTSEGRISGTSAIVIVEPVVSAGETQGYIALSVPHQALILTDRRIAGPAPIDTVTFNRDGQVLTSKLTLEDVADRLPREVTLASLAEGDARSFAGHTVEGDRRLFTFAPLYGDSIFALSAWPASAALSGGVTATTAVAFPVLMWIVCLGVAYLAVHRLVIRHIADLRQGIRRFSVDRRILPIADGGYVPSELREVIEAFQTMTRRIVHDEAEQEDSLHEKDVLLREVHHRVKNNLQLIASIANMQVRKARSEETRFMLRRLQDRILSLATIHRNLYQATVLSKVDSAVLVAELVAQIAGAGIPPDSDLRIETGIDPVCLYPDQAVPLSLLTTEAVTNAIKYVGRPDDGAPWITVALTAHADDSVTLRVANSTGSPVAGPGAHESTGLGRQLMAAFVMQLGATSHVSEANGAFVLEVTFRRSAFLQDADAA